MRVLPALAALLALASCVSPKPAPVAPRPPAASYAPPPAPEPRPAPLASDWRDWPQTPGDWHYQAVTGGSVAIYGDASRALFALQCDQRGRRVIVSSYVPQGGSFTVRTTSVSRVLSFYIEGDPPGGSVISELPATDPLLDAIAFTRGRFVVEQPGRPSLVLPAWAEVGRVIEDCRG